MQQQVSVKARVAPMATISLAGDQVEAEVCSPKMGLSWLHCVAWIHPCT